MSISLALSVTPTPTSLCSLHLTSLRAHTRTRAGTWGFPATIARDGMICFGNDLFASWAPIIIHDQTTQTCVYSPQSLTVDCGLGLDDYMATAPTGSVTISYLPSDASPFAPTITSFFWEPAQGTIGRLWKRDLTTTESVRTQLPGEVLTHLAYIPVTSPGVCNNACRSTPECIKAIYMPGAPSRCQLLGVLRSNGHQLTPKTTSAVQQPVPRYTSTKVRMLEDVKTGFMTVTRLVPDPGPTLQCPNSFGERILMPSNRTWAINCDANVAGHDMPNGIFLTDPNYIDGCLSLCDRTNGCVAFVQAGSHCHLKNSISLFTRLDGVKGGYLRSLYPVGPLTEKDENDFWGQWHQRVFQSKWY